MTYGGVPSFKGKLRKKKSIIQLNVILLVLSWASVTQAQLDFRDPIALEKASTPEQLITGDFDGNGFSDIGFKGSNGLLYIKYNQSNGTFIDATFNYLTVISGVTPSASGDLNKDGKTDIAFYDNGVANNGQRVTVLLSLGTTFKSTKVGLAGSKISKDLKIMDFDGDGNQDILYLVDDDNTMYFYKGDGTGNFTVNSIPNLSSGRSFIVGDFNLDGAKDFAILSYSKQALVFTKSGNSYTTSTYNLTGEGLEIISADFSGDGVLDLVAIEASSPNTLTYLINDGTGTFTKTTISTPLSPFRGLDYLDFNGDGRMDILTGSFNSSGAIILMQNNGTSFVSISVSGTTDTGYITDVAFLDLDKDGTYEVVGLSTNKVISIKKKSGGNYVDFKTYVFGTLGFTGSINDLDKDGLPDILVSNTFISSFSILYGGNNNSLKKTLFIPTSGTPTQVQSADFNSDGYPDIIYSTAGGAGLYKMLSDGIGGYANAVFLGPATSVIALGDLNNDQKTDIFTGATAYLSNGNGTFSTKSPSQGLLDAKIADLNGDGKNDVVLVSSSNLLVIGINDGTANFTFSNITTTNTIKSISLADVNGDNKTDIIVAGLNTNNATILLNQGNIQFQESKNLATNASPSGIVVADFNQDGLVDIAVSSYPNELKIYVQATGFNFSSALSNSYPTFDNMLGGDFNVDGKPDLILLCLNGNPVDVVLNDMTKAPTTAPTLLSFTNIQGPSAKINLTKGNGNGRIIIAKEVSASGATPTDGIFYASNYRFGIGNQISTGSYVVASSDSTSYTITNLKSNTDYFISVFEYNVSQRNTLIDYLKPAIIGSFKSDIVTVPVTVIVTGLEEQQDQKYILYPNPAEKTIFLKGPGIEKSSLAIFDIRGAKQEMTTSTENQIITIDSGSLSPGLYILNFSTPNGIIREKLIIH